MEKYVRFLIICAIGLAAGILYIWSRSHPALKSSQINQETRKPGSDRELNRKKPQILDSDELEELASLPYTNWSSTAVEINKAGVVHFEQDKAFQGMNLYNSRNLSRAYLIDMNGKIMHTWSVPGGKNDSWHSIKMMNDGDLFAIVENKKLLRLGWNSQIKWEYKARFHHDLEISPSGLIYVLTRRLEMWSTKDFRIPVVKEYVTVLDHNGRFVREISLFEALSPLISEDLIARIHSLASEEKVQEWLKNDKDRKNATWLEEKGADVFHVNSIQLIDRDISGIAQKGDFLLSVRQLNLICVFRTTGNSGKLIWSWGSGEIQCQHHPRLLENGNILLFDNGCKRRYSRVIELDPRTRRIVWEYKASRPEEFFSYRRGGVQRLPNGNTLLTESDHGRVIEVSRDGKIVWEFFNPDVQIEKKRRAVIFRMIRIPASFLSQLR